LLPPTIDPPPETPPPEGPRKPILPRPRKPPFLGLSPAEILLLIAIALLLVLEAALAVDPEQWAMVQNWARQIGTADAIQRGIDVLIEAAREAPR